MTEQQSNSDFLNDLLNKANGGAETQDIKNKNSGHDNVSVGEKAPKSKSADSIKDGFTEKERLEAEMNFKFNIITEENFNEKILDLQIFFSTHHKMLDDFMSKLSKSISNADDECSKINQKIMEKRTDDSLIMKGEMESLEEELHKAGKQLRVLLNIKKSIL